MDFESLVRVQSYSKQKTEENWRLRLSMSTTVDPSATLDFKGFSLRILYPQVLILY